MVNKDEGAIEWISGSIGVFLTDVLEYVDELSTLLVESLIFASKAQEYVDEAAILTLSVSSGILEGLLLPQEGAGLGSGLAQA